MLYINALISWLLSIYTQIIKTNKDNLINLNGISGVRSLIHHLLNSSTTTTLRLAPFPHDYAGFAKEIHIDYPKSWLFGRMIQKQRYEAVC